MQSTDGCLVALLETLGKEAGDGMTRSKANSWVFGQRAREPLAA